jgi:hypothetical protein
MRIRVSANPHEKDHACKVFSCRRLLGEDPEAGDRASEGIGRAADTKNGPRGRRTPKVRPGATV